MTRADVETHKANQGCDIFPQHFGIIFAPTRNKIIIYKKKKYKKETIIKAQNMCSLKLVLKISI